MTRKTRFPALTCVHCHAKSIVRDSAEVTTGVRELRMSCTNDDCGHTFVAQLSLIRTIRPSARPNPSVRVPFGEWYPERANDDHPLPANDEGAIAAAVVVVMSG